jgi:hypothetical protein
MMHKTYLAKNIGKWVKIRPIMKRIDPTRGELTPIDYPWLIQDVTDFDEIVLRCDGAGHTAKFGLDHIKEFRTDPGGSGGFLMLKSQFISRGATLDIEPL